MAERYYDFPDVLHELRTQVLHQDELAHRLLDLVLGLVLLLVLSPLMLVLGALVWAFDGRPILYRGDRVGRDGRLFRMYKFRTMHLHSETRIGKRLMRSDDHVTTRLGRVLRFLKLDELPQLWSIVAGDMSFVGPRPVRPAMACDYALRVEGYERRFAVRPGLTGLAQIRGGYYCNPWRKTRYDLFYIRHRSIAYNLRLMVETCWYMAGSITRLKKRAK